MDKETFLELRAKVVDAGYGEEIIWSESLKPCDSAQTFWQEYMWVVICAGMREQVARKIYGRIRQALFKGKSLDDAFHHKGKVHAISQMVLHKHERFKEYQEASDKLAYLASLPYIGNITKYHLAKNLGVDVAKPDRHLMRIAISYGIDTATMCENLAEVTGYRISTVDIIIWRAANLGFV